MADKALFVIGPMGPTPEQRQREDQHRRRNLRIAIRQLERAELYLVALYSLKLEDKQAELKADELIQRLRSLRHYLSELKATV